MENINTSLLAFLDISLSDLEKSNFSCYSPSQRKLDIAIEIIEICESKGTKLPIYEIDFGCIEENMSKEDIWDFAREMGEPDNYIYSEYDDYHN